MASAPPLPDNDALPSYEEAITSGIPLNPSNTRSYDSLPRSRINTGDYGVPRHPVKGQYEDEDSETALLQAELQRLRQENLEAKKQLLRQEIENEILKAAGAARGYPPPPANVVPTQHHPVPVPQPSSSAIIPVRSDQSTDGVENEIPHLISPVMRGCVALFVVLVVTTIFILYLL